MPPISFQQCPIKPKSDVKYLGVYFDEGLTWEKQANHIRQKVYSGLNKIKRVSSTLDDATKRLLINALVYSHLNYCMNTWSNTLAHVSNRFVSLTRQIDRVVPMNKPFDKLKKFNTAVMAFKAVNKISPLYLSKHLPLIQNPNGVSTRANKQKKLRVTKVHNNFDKKTFLYNATKVWNDLPNELRTSQSLVTFKSKAKSHFFDV